MPAFRNHMVSLSFKFILPYNDTRVSATQCEWNLFRGINDIVAKRETLGGQFANSAEIDAYLLNQ